MPSCLLLFLQITTILCVSVSLAWATQSSFGLEMKQEKQSHFRFYWHDILSGPSPTSVSVVNPPKKSATGFGMVNMIDNPLTQGPKLSSKLVGRAQGFYALDSQKELGLLMAMNFVFVEGKYNGSSITVLGRNMVFHKVREMPVIGGTGLFRACAPMVFYIMGSYVSVIVNILYWSA